ncbi:hypothetical protein Tco_0707124 [Tanacetum coccineum]|uniref:Retrotransposon gag domain-containing protein n=1 Tax=Tanacetum coccineum TaxID=301880 RepID=A0ABQ4YBI6_9ASTR
MLNDRCDIPLNNEQNEPTQGNISKTSNEATQVTTPPQRNEFEELYASANQEPYPGCDFMTPLEFMAKFTHLKVSGKWIDTSFNDTLKFLQEAFLVRLQRLYKSNHTAKHMIWHATGKSTDSAFGKHLEEIHTLWTQFRKKRDKIETLLKDTQDLVYRLWRRCHNFM